CFYGMSQTLNYILAGAIITSVAAGHLVKTSSIESQPQDTSVNYVSYRDSLKKLDDLTQANQEFLVRDTLERTKEEALARHFPTTAHPSGFPDQPVQQTETAAV